MAGEGVSRDDVSGGVIGKSEEGVNEESKCGGCEWEDVSGRVWCEWGSYEWGGCGVRGRCEWGGCGVSGRFE